MKLSKYLTLVRCGIISQLQFRAEMILTFVGNLFYLLIVYYLWRAIFASSGSEVVNGMTFQDTMIYLVFASSLFSFMEVWLVWQMGRDIQSGQIVLDLLRPMPYKNYLFWNFAGEIVCKFFTTFLPTSIVVYFISGGAITLGINLIWFVISVTLSILINFYINFFVGTVCMHTESIWGINIMKEVIVGLLSGATIPLAFFPERIREIMMVLPFQAVINSPMSILLHSEYSIMEVSKIIGIQLFWAVSLWIVTEVYFRMSVKKITVNGG